MTLLLLVLTVTGLTAVLTKARTASWSRPLWVALYPVNADGSETSVRYIEALDATAFTPIDVFFAREARRYAVPLAKPVETHLYAPVKELPPALDPGSGMFGTMLWSLRIRYWAWRVTQARNEATPDAQMFVLYNDPERTASVPHSLGLEKGMLGIVYAYAARRATRSNDVVIAHELMHTLGATDKYDPATDAPRYPEGYAEPQRKPLIPQPSAEIMAGRMMTSTTSWETPDSLDAVVMGPQSAREISWQR